MPKLSKKYPRLSCPATGCPLVTIDAASLRLQTIWGHCERMKREIKRKAALEKRLSKRLMLPCPVKGCPYQTNYAGSLDAHRTVEHPQKFPSTCRTCGKSIRGSLNDHMQRHASIKPFPCVFDGCDQSFAAPRDPRRHKKTHTIQGQIRQKRQENRLNKELKHSGYIVDIRAILSTARHPYTQSSASA